MIPSAVPSTSGRIRFSLTPSGIGFPIRACALLCILAVMSWLLHRFHLDDSYIYARYVRNALQGRGLVFNTGEHVNALTSIFFTWIMLAAGSVLHGNLIAIQEAFSAIFLVAALLLAERAAPLAGIIIASCPLLYACKGMETSLFLLILMLCVQAYIAERSNWLPLLCTIAMLTRFEGGAMAVVICWCLFRERRFPRVYSYVLPALLIAVYLWFNLHFYHAPLPQSASAKLGQGMSGFWGPWPTAFLLVPLLAVQPLGGSFVYFVVLGVLAYFATRSAAHRRWNSVVTPFLIFLAAFYVLFNIPSYHWYYAPFVYFLFVSLAHGLPDTPWTLGAASLVLLAMLYATAMELHAIDKGTQPYIAIAQWLDSNTPPAATIAAVETGHLGWYCNRRLIDMVGLTTPRNGTYTAHRDFKSWMLDHPDYVVVHPLNPFPWERVALESPDYELLPFHVDGVSVLRRRIQQAPLMKGTP